MNPPTECERDVEAISPEKVDRVEEGWDSIGAESEEVRAAEQRRWDEDIYRRSECNLETSQYYRRSAQGNAVICWPERIETEQDEGEAGRRTKSGIEEQNAKAHHRLLFWIRRVYILRFLLYFEEILLNCAVSTTLTHKYV